jgi:hypothetical protein
VPVGKPSNGFGAVRCSGDLTKADYEESLADVEHGHLPVVSKKTSYESLERQSRLAA